MIVIVTQESNEIKVVILMNGIFLVPIGWQIGKQIMKSCTNSEPQGEDRYHAVGNYNNHSDDEGGQVTCCSILLLVASLLCALGGCGYAVLTVCHLTFFLCICWKVILIKECQ